MRFLALIFLYTSINITTCIAQNYNLQYLQVVTFNEKADSTVASLIFNNKESIYTYGKNAQKGELKSSGKEYDDVVNFDIKLTDRDGFIYYKDLQNKQLLCRELLFTKPVLINDTYPEIKWVISDTATKEIAKFKCKKAVGSFRGRKYTVWFAEDLPVSTGPWKLGGLPGLILEASDTDGVVTYTIISLDKTAEPVVIPSGSVKMTQQQFVQKFKMKAQNLTRYLKTSVKSGEAFETKTSFKLNTLERSLFDD